ncbi:helicase-related protein [Nitratidesulfovibrio sp. SRB-5]|uniref:helicase-related protein n=1 Tax=Nitratidesulfovibrio sp. SRB-5 TaxID=2872636 RepID=UPI00102620FA|nr:helicase-related protein [Nitratidesulfovibrio sp. SRB-5]MBZ2171963.1 hypothetical protein [Nitratidesulfovibrio sp. SRB-5]RXF78556.1 hypothetical protein EKK70_00800 [Desulfovibrio sp. DS-1]
MVLSLEYIEKALICKSDLEEKFLLDALQCVYHEIQSKGNSSVVTSIICRISALKYKSELVVNLLRECIVASRIFIYSDMLGGVDGAWGSIFSDVAQDCYSRPSGIVLTLYQKKILSEYKKHKRIVVSAPTSFGKSTIVPELIDESDKNVCIVVPTLSLLSEYVSRFIQDSRFRRYNIVYTSSQGLGRRNIFIVTPERMDIILDQHPDLGVDFFVMDEVYKISNSDDRSLIFANCLYRLANRVSRFYLIGPYYDEFSVNFLKRFNAHFLRFDVEVVAKNKLDISDVSRGNIYDVKGVKVKKTADKYKNLSRLVAALEGQTLVYVAKTHTAEVAAKHISSNLVESATCEGLIDFVSSTIGREWSLGEYLKRKVAFHHALMPKYVQREIVYNFNVGAIDTLVCTSTLIEGVNTSAQNVVVFDNMKGIAPLTGFDVKNIEGRSGRLGRHFVGENYFLVETPSKANVGNVDFVFLDSNELDDEVNLLVSDGDLTDVMKKRREHILHECRENGVSLSLLRSNKYIKVDKQLALVRYFRDNPDVMREMHFSGTLPVKETLKIWLRLAYEYLMSDSQKHEKDLPQNIVINKAIYYVYKNPTIYEFVNGWSEGSFDARVRKTFKLVTRIFEFALPKSLFALENIYNYMNGSQIDTSHVVSLLEHGLGKKHEVLLKEAGIPPNIIKKISKFFDETYSIRDIQAAIDSADLSRLTEYEKKILQRTLLGENR